MTHILHINDNNLLVQTTPEQGGKVLHRSRGYAWLKGEDVLFDINSDESPVHHCRLAPQQINTRYWQQCAQTAIASNNAGMRHAADLVWKHLAELKVVASLDNIALVVPANYRDSHLQLLLGVAHANGLDVSALVSKPVLAVTQQQVPKGQYVHIDVQLHQVVVSTLAVTAEAVTLDSAEVKTDVGLHTMQESLLHIMQQNFIRSDRFDPLHDADTEQQLFDQLPALVESAINDEKATVGVQSNGKLYSTTVESNEIASAFSALVDLTKQHPSSPVLLDLNAGFDLRGLSGLGGENIVWAKTPKSFTVEATTAKNAQGNVIYQTTLATEAPARDTPTAVEPVKPVASVETSTPSNDLSSEVVTHLMQLGVAVPIGHADISISGAVLSLNPTAASVDIAAMLRQGDLHIVNAPERKELKPNDRLMSPVADGVITAVAVL